MKRQYPRNSKHNTHFNYKPRKMAWKRRYRTGQPAFRSWERRNRVN
jgi:hypothetical protein